MKKISTILMASTAVLAVSVLSACGGSSTSSESTSAPAATSAAAATEAASAAPSAEASAAAAGACDASTFTTIKDGTLTIATYDGMPYFGQDGDAQKGIDADILNRLAADCGLSAEWVVVPAAGVIESVKSGRADVAAGGWYATPERGEIVNLSDPMYVELPTILSKEGTSNIQDLKGKKVGTITGYAWVDDLKNLFGGDVKEYQSTDAAIADLAAGRIDAALLGGIDAPYLVSQNPAYSGIISKTMDPDPAIAVSVTPTLPNYPATKGNDALTAAINAEIAAMQADNFIKDTLTKYSIDPGIADVQKFQQ